MSQHTDSLIPDSLLNCLDLLGRLPTGTGVVAIGSSVLLALAVCLMLMGAGPGVVFATLATSMIGGAALLGLAVPYVAGLMGAAVGRPYAANLWRTGLRRAIAYMVHLVRLAAALRSRFLLAFFAITDPLTLIVRARIPAHLALGWRASVHPHLT